MSCLHSLCGGISQRPTHCSGRAVAARWVSTIYVLFALPLRQQDGQQSLDARHRGDPRVACFGKEGQGMKRRRTLRRAGCKVAELLRAEGARGAIEAHRPKG